MRSGCTNPGPIACANRSHRWKADVPQGVLGPTWYSVPRRLISSWERDRDPGPLVTHRKMLGQVANSHGLTRDPEINGRIVCSTGKWVKIESFVFFCASPQALWPWDQTSCPEEPPDSDSTRRRGQAAKMRGTERACWGRLRSPAPFSFGILGSWDHSPDFGSNRRGMLCVYPLQVSVCPRWPPACQRPTRH